MIEARGITVRYGDRLVLDRYDFSAPEEGLTFLSGPSGEGKTTLLRVLAGLLTPETGQVSLPGRPVILFQEDRLFPGLSVRRQVEAVLPKGRREEADRWLELTELTQAAHLLPGELSGGMARRASLARALALEPEVLLCDEATSALDVSTQDQLVELLVELQRQRELAILFVCHDLALVQSLSHRIMVMYLGVVVESLPSRCLANDALHPYAKALLESVFSLHDNHERPIVPLCGEVPSPIDRPAGCPFHTRCPHCMEHCAQEEPPMTAVAPGHTVACHLYD